MFTIIRGRKLLLEIGLYIIRGLLLEIDLCIIKGRKNMG